MRFEDLMNVPNLEEHGEYVSIDIHTWKTDGETFIGELKEVSDFEGGNFEKKCKKYLFKTDRGLKTTILGASVDTQIDPDKYIGHVLLITYRGQIQLDNGRSCNRFTVVDVTKQWIEMQKRPKEQQHASKDNQTLGEKKTMFGKR